jgi:DNA-binding response OmpR family regulator
MANRQNRILLVDDDAEIVEAVSLALSDHGYEVLVARDGAEALVRIERDAPDLIILDVIMPKRSGFMVLDHIRRSQVRLPHVIMVSANDEQRHRDFAAEKGANVFLRKPFDIDELLAAVDSILSA